MSLPKIATVINFCSNEARFLESCVQQCRLFSRQIVIPVCDHLFDGTPEDAALLQQAYAAFPDCLFVEYPFISDPLPKRMRNGVSLPRFWHCISRLVGTQSLKDDIDMVLFLDVDEVPDGNRFLDWLNQGSYAQHSALMLESFWYFREARYQALNWEEAGLLVQKLLLTGSMLVNENERRGIYLALPEPKRRAATGADGLPMIHHFSWVRTKEEMLSKVRAWGHRADRDWEQLVEQEFSAPFSGKDFVHGYSFQESPPPFPVSLQPPQFAPLPNKEISIKRLTINDLLKIIRQIRGGWLNRICSFCSIKALR